MADRGGGSGVTRVAAWPAPAGGGRRAARGMACAALWVFGASVGLGVAGCDPFDPTLLGDAATAAALRHPPPRPSGPDLPNGEELTFALRDIVLAQDAERWRDIGLDLDGLDSQPPDPRVECIPPRTGARPETDGTEGIDNAFGHRLWPLIALALPDFEEKVAEAHGSGRGAMLIRVEGYSGADDDPRVEVTIAQSVDGTSLARDAVHMEGTELLQADGSAAPPPAWEGADTFIARGDAFFRNDPEAPLVADDNAYVAGRTLVARLPDRVDLLFFADDAGVRIRLTDATILGRMSADRSTLEDALVAGRFALLDLLETSDYVGVCDGTPERDLAARQFETIADVRSSPGTGGPDVECDAVSVAVGFTGVRGHWGGISEDVQPLPNRCAMDE